MGFEDKKFISFREIEGVISPHQGQITGGMKLRKEALEYVADVSKLAEFIGGKVESLGLGEDWAISKEIFPEANVFFIYNHADEEVPSNLRVLYSGDRMKLMKGEELASITIAYTNHMLRYVREANPGKNLPEVCFRI